MKYALAVLIILVVVLTITVAFLLGEDSATVDAVPTLRETPTVCDSVCIENKSVIATHDVFGTNVYATGTALQLTLDASFATPTP